MSSRNLEMDKRRRPSFYAPGRYADRSRGCRGISMNKAWQDLVVCSQILSELIDVTNELESILASKILFSLLHASFGRLSHAHYPLFSHGL